MAAILVGAIVIGCFVISFLQLKQKGFLFNNAYIYASKEERETMDKKPHYRQSGIIFALIGIMLLLLAVEIIAETGWLMHLVWMIVVIAVIYAIVSSIKIERKKK